ncbi:MAG: exosortase system-associated protein, TIGR04073 family [Candidatus Omnitrophota bacterium]|nr:exosortase system-associated protein, TIGR04073 family [Candidatus Omnitrophota bacterium]
MKSRTFILTLVILCGVVGQALAGGIAPEGTVARKIQRGFLNIVFSPIEVSHELHKEKKVESFVPSWFSGVGRGGAFMIGRVLTGIYEIVTAPFPMPANYEPVLYPEFPWEHFDSVETS